MNVYFGFLIFIVVSFVGCTGDRVVSSFLFENYCSEEGRTGQFIYERVGLGDEYFIPLPKDERDFRYVDKGFFIDDRKLLIDKQRFMREFEINRVKTQLSEIGPIIADESLIVRKLDGKVLNRSVDLVNKNGWLARKAIFGITDVEFCPKKRNEFGQLFYVSSHHDQIRNTFYKK